MIHTWLAVLRLLGCIGAVYSQQVFGATNGVTARELRFERGHPAGFARVDAAEAGIHFTNVLGATLSLTNTPVNNGSGVALGDVDGDGYCDVLLCAIDGTNVLYRNRGGWRFEDVTAAAGLAMGTGHFTGAVFADVDGDGDCDLLVNALGRGTRLFVNDGQGRFQERTDAGLEGGSGSMSLALADVDGDGDLDLYVVNYRATTILDQPQTRFGFTVVNGKPVLSRVNGVPVTDPALSDRFQLNAAGMPREMGEPDALYLNDGTGRFSRTQFEERFTDEQGRPVPVPRDWGLGAMFRDLNGDGAPDLYVCNDTDSPDRIWINDGRGHFAALPALAMRHTSLSSMGVDVADVNRDGVDDVFVVDMMPRRHAERMTFMEHERVPPGVPGQFNDRPQYGANTLFLGRRDGTFREVAAMLGVQATDWSWNPYFVDVDLDGYEDLLVANGFHRNVLDSDVAGQIAGAKKAQRLTPAQELRLRERYPAWPGTHPAFRNERGERFVEMGRAWGFAGAAVSQGMAMGDLDGDGDLDVVLNNLNAAPTLLRNAGGGHRVAVRLKGRGGNTQGIGARIVVRGGPVQQAQEVIAGGRYLSGADPLRVFAAGDARSLELEVRWRSGRRSVITNAAPDRIYEVDESGSVEWERPAKRVVKPIFEDVSGRIAHGNTTEAFDDRERQPLLPHSLSAMGPGVAWCDLNGDGNEDLVIGAGRGGRLSVLSGDGQGRFRTVGMEAWNEVSVEEEVSVVGWQAEPGNATLLVGTTNYRMGGTNGAAVKRYEVALGEVTRGGGFPGVETGTGPVVVADMDGDGDVDVFVGGRVKPGKYPEGGGSRLYRNERGEPVLDEANSGVLKGIGMATGAVWTDLDGDGYPELVVACEWGCVRVYANRRGRLEDATEAWGLGRLTGWWMGVAAGDLDGDGRMDLVVGNWGWNHGQRDRRPRMYSGDVDGNGTWDVLESEWDPEMDREVPRRDLGTMGRAMPWLQERYGTYREYGEKGLEEIYGDRLKGLRKDGVERMDTVMMLNRGGRFEVKALPAEAQEAPVYGVNIGDMDGDGAEDVFLSQNHFGMDAESGRMDAGRGLWLKGDGKGGLTVVDGEESGVKVYGEQRGSALGDFDGDGRVDLVVTQHGAGTKLYRNVWGEVGLRVRLVGGMGNLGGIGAVLRYGKGAAREVHGGSGYGSQDGAVTVLGTGGKAGELEVVWPGGGKTRVSVPAGTREMKMMATGEVEWVK